MYLLLIETCEHDGEYQSLVDLGYVTTSYSDRALLSSKISLSKIFCGSGGRWQERDCGILSLVQ